MAGNPPIRIAARGRAPDTREWTRAEYDRLIDLGILDEDEPIELLGGEMVVREPQAGPHATSVHLVQQVLQLHRAAGLRLERLAVGAEHRAERGVLQTHILRPAGLPGRREDLGEVLRLS